MKKWIGLWILVFCFVSCSDDDEKADSIELSAVMLNYESEGGEQGILIQSSAEWKVVSEVAWCFVQENREAGQFSVIVSENPDFNPPYSGVEVDSRELRERSGYFAAREGGRTVSV